MHYADPPIEDFFIPKDQDVETHTGLVKEPAIAPTPLIERIRNGLSLKDFEALRKLLDIPEELLGKFLGMSNATLHRRKKSMQFSPAESERLVRFMRLFGLTLNVFETKEAARSWLKAENPGTNHESPLSYSDTEFGAREVENLLGRLDHGVF